MTRPVPLFADPIEDIISHLDSVLSYHVAEDLTGWSKGNTWVTIHPTGGVVINPNRSFEPRYDVNVYASSKKLAQDVSLEVIQEIYKMLNLVLDSGSVVTFVETSWPADIQDPLNSNPRFVFDATFRIRTP